MHLTKFWWPPSCRWSTYNLSQNARKSLCLTTFRGYDFANERSSPSAVFSFFDLLHKSFQTIRWPCALGGAPSNRPMTAPGLSREDVLSLSSIVMDTQVPIKALLWTFESARVLKDAISKVDDLVLHFCRIINRIIASSAALLEAIRGINVGSPLPRVRPNSSQESIAKQAAVVQSFEDSIMCEVKVRKSFESLISKEAMFTDQIAGAAAGPHQPDVLMLSVKGNTISKEFESIRPENLMISCEIIVRRIVNLSMRGKRAAWVTERLSRPLQNASTAATSTSLMRLRALSLPPSRKFCGHAIRRTRCRNFWRTRST